MRVDKRQQLRERVTNDLRAVVVESAEANELTAAETVAVLLDIARDYAKHAVEDERDNQKELDQRPYRD